MRAKARKISLYLLFFVTLLAYFSAWWAVRTYGSISMEEIVFHLNVPLDGVNTEYIVSYLGTALAPSLASFVSPCSSTAGAASFSEPGKPTPVWTSVWGRNAGMWS